MSHKKDFNDCFLDTILYLSLSCIVGFLIYFFILEPITLAIIVGAMTIVFGLAGICYWWNNRG